MLVCEVVLIIAGVVAWWLYPVTVADVVGAVSVVEVTALVALVVATLEVVVVVAGGDAAEDVPVVMTALDVL